MKNILCYGDSNTWGYVPTKDHAGVKNRYPLNKRWPGILQNLLGENFHVIEEGLNSRTTNIDHTSPPDRNGKTYLAPCLYSHAPIDLVILALGGNDTKLYFNRSAADIKNGLVELIDMIKSSNYGPGLTSAPEILILSPVIPYVVVEEEVDENGVYFMKGAVRKAKEVTLRFAELAADKEYFYLDLSNIAPSNIDGVHYDEKGHTKVAEMVREIIEDEIFK